MHRFATEKKEMSADHCHQIEVRQQTINSLKGALHKKEEKLRNLELKNSGLQKEIKALADHLSDQKIQSKDSQTKIIQLTDELKAAIQQSQSLKKK